MPIYRPVQPARASLTTFRYNGRGITLAGAIIATEQRTREDARLQDIRKSTRDGSLYATPTRNLTPRMHHGNAYR